MFVPGYLEYMYIHVLSHLRYFSNATFDTQVAPDIRVYV
jgi:hypothetical protein